MAAAFQVATTLISLSAGDIDPWWAVALRHRWQALHVIYVNAGSVCAAIICTWALIRGGQTERLAAATIGIGWILTDLFQAHSQRSKELQVIVLDGVVFLIFVWLSLRSRKPWTMYLAACQLAGLAVRVMAHVIAFGFKSYITIVGIFSGWALLVALAVGTYQFDKQRKDLKR